MFGAILQNPVTPLGVHPPCSLLFMHKEFLTRPVLDFVLPCCIPKLGYLKCISAAPLGVLPFIDIGGDFSLKNQSLTRPGTKQEVTSSVGSYCIKCIGLLEGKAAFCDKSNFPAFMQATIFKPVVLCKAPNYRVFFTRALSFLFCCV